jgi:hypothetical protein
MQHVFFYSGTTGVSDLPRPAEYVRGSAGDDPMPFTFDELLIWAWQLVMVVDHRNKTPETMEVLQNEWEAKGLVKNCTFSLIKRNQTVEKETGNAHRGTQ